MERHVAAAFFYLDDLVLSHISSLLKSLSNGSIYMPSLAHKLGSNKLVKRWHMSVIIIVKVTCAIRQWKIFYSVFKKVNVWSKTTSLALRLWFTEWVNSSCSWLIKLASN